MDLVSYSARAEVLVYMIILETTQQFAKDCCLIELELSLLYSNTIQQRVDETTIKLFNCVQRNGLRCV